MTERHYNDDEVAAIFRAATEGAESQAGRAEHAEGLTLRDIQAIAGEVGISPVAITRAAQSLDRPSGPAVSQRFLGLPIAVERTVALERRLAETEWERLVVGLRQVFRARGTMRSHGSMREWSNGNLQALLEPTATGYQLRISTVKGNARPSVAMGAMMLGVSSVVTIAVAATGNILAAAPGLAALAAVGAGMIANGTLRLPSWARRRRQQMDSIVEQVAEMTHQAPPEPTHSSDTDSTR